MKKITCILFCFILKTSVFSQGLNIGFESSTPGAYTASNAISGWTLSSQTATCGTSTPWTAGSSEFSIIATPILSFPSIGNIVGSPIGGNNVARLNNSTANSSRTKLAQTFSVNSSHSVLRFAYAGVWEGYGSHSCCEQTGFSIQIKDVSGTILSCLTYSFGPGPGCTPSGMSFTTSISSAWTNWKLNYIDLSPFINSFVTLEVIGTDCNFGDHSGTLLYDCDLTSQFVAFNTGIGVSLFTTFPQTSLVSYCPGSNIAQLTAIPGYVSYQWIAPGTGSVATPQGTMTTLSVNAPVANSIYTLVMVSASGCIYTTTYLISPSSVTIAAIGSNSTCAGGTGGTATVIANGSSTGYTYTWLNSTNSIVASSSVAAGLSPGVYSVNVTAAGSSSSVCGSASRTLTIGVAQTSVISLLKPYCANEAYLGISGGSNYQWYNGTASISASQGGTASSYTITNPYNLGIYRLTYLSAFGCTDSIEFTLIASSPGSLSVSYNPTICLGASNGTAVISMIPANGAPAGQNSYSVFSIGTISPVYSASLNPTASNTFTATNLFAGGSYSVKAFDGSCKYTTNFSVTPYVFNYTLSPTTTPTLCNGNSIATGVSFTSSPSLTQYSYSWSPTTYLLAGNGNSQSTILTASPIPSGSQTIIYTVVVTPSLINCPLTKTLTISFANPASPNIAPVPSFCANASNYSISVSPLGGNFINGSGNAINPSGVLSPSMANIGINTFTYANSIGTCVAKSTATFMINAPPQISISGNTLICEGGSTSLLANGPASFTWNTIANGPVISVSPSVTTQYTVSAYNASTQCFNSKTLTVNVLPLPQISISGDSLLCAGETITLMASGANSYSWNTGSNTQNITVSPTSSTNYSVIGTNNIGNCSNTKVISVTVYECTGIDKSDVAFTDFKIFPNPSSGIVFIEIENKLQISIFDNLGKLISQKELEKGIHKIDLSEYKAGVYLLKISNPSAQKALKIIKTED